MTETRIRWSDDGTEGYVGTVSQRIFTLYPPQDGGEWMMTAALPGFNGRIKYRGTPEELHPDAERWLSEFTVSIGASFPAETAETFAIRPVGKAFEALYAPGRRVRFEHPDKGYPVNQEMAARFLTPGEVYTIEWSDVGSSSTRLRLAGIETRGQGFNSVLFEPVPDEPAKEGQ